MRNIRNITRFGRSIALLRVRRKAGRAVLSAGVFALGACGSDPVGVPPEGSAQTGSGITTDSTDTTPRPAPVTAFDLTVTVLAGGSGHGASVDTLGTTPVPGAVVTLTRVRTLQGDTVTTDVSAGVAVADAQGQVRFVQVPNGYFFVVRATPPAGHAFGPAALRFAPGLSEATVAVKLWLGRS